MFFTTADVFVCAIRSFPMPSIIAMTGRTVKMIRVVLTFVAIASYFTVLSLH